MKRLVVILMFTAMGCSDPTSVEQQRLELSTDRATYHYTDRLQLTFLNHGPEPVGPRGALGCLLKLELRLGDSWEPVSLPLEACILVGGYAVQPNEAVVREFEVTQDLFAKAGTYRFVTSQGTGKGEPLRVTSNTLEVAPPS